MPAHGFAGGLLMGAAASVAGAIGRRRARWHQARRRLSDLEVEAEVAEVRLRLELARKGKHRHDLINALTAVEGAAMILTQETLSATERATFAGVLGSGLSRLRGLLFAGPEADHVELAGLAASLAGEPGWPDNIHVDVAPDLVVAGAPGEIAEAVRQLVTHARRRAPSCPVTMRAERRGDHITLWVDDQGPPLFPRGQRRIQAPAGRRSLRSGPVGGLQVAVRLARDQGGQVSVESRPGGGTATGISLPAYRG